jgi:hypothetical protein
MSMGLFRDIGAWIKGYLARIPETITAGAGNDGVEVSGPWINVANLPGHGAVALLVWSATLAEDETLSLAANLQDATDSGGTGAADFGTALANAVVATGPTGGGTVNGVTEMRIPEFNGNRGYVRLQSTADLSATGTDTVDVAAILVVGGGHVLPVTSGEQS